jgi:tetratricopeptide repeat protein/DUF2914 family protein
MSDLRDAERMLEAAEQAAVADDLTSADALLREAARIQEAELGPVHPDLANTLNNLAVVAEKTGRFGDADTFYRRAVAIASASLPAGDPMIAASRKNLEDFCRSRGLPIETSTATEVTPPRAVPRRLSRSLAPAVIGVIIVIVTAIFVARRPLSSRETPAALPKAEPTAPPPATEPARPTPAAPTVPAPIERAQPSTVPRPPGAITLATAQLCLTVSTSGGNWGCDPAVDPVSPGPLVFYTRVRSPRDAVVVHRWYRGDTLRQSVTLTIRANATEGYRTFSRQSVDGGADWHVEVRTAEGALLHEQHFVVR